ncbi:MAG: hypothetical protein J6T80_05125 [Paludibacteraceae bacterium]|nr:hypothetical protein [Paludibacteraceae bacterium]
MKKVCLILATIIAMTLLTGCEKKTPQVGYSPLRSVVVVENNCPYDVTLMVEKKDDLLAFSNVPAHSTSEPQEIADPDTGIPTYAYMDVTIEMWDSVAVTTRDIYSERMPLPPPFKHTFIIDEDCSVFYSPQELY